MTTQDYYVHQSHHLVMDFSGVGRQITLLEWGMEITLSYADGRTGAGDSAAYGVNGDSHC